MAVPSPAPRPTIRTIFDEHAAFVLRVVRRLGVRDGDVEDMAQEVFVVVHRKLEQYDPQYSVRTWLFGIARRVASDYRRRAHVQREIPSADAGETAVNAEQHDHSERAELRRILDAALDLLDDDKREVLVLYELEQLPMTEVAALVGCPVQTAYSRLHKAREIVAERVRRNQRARIGTR